MSMSMRLRQVPAAECAAAYLPLLFSTSQTATVVDAGQQAAFSANLGLHPDPRPN